jgi:hypothetical protein
MDYTKYKYLFHKYLLQDEECLIKKFNYNVLTYNTDNIKDYNNNNYNNKNYDVVANVHCYNIDIFENIYSDYIQYFNECDLIVITYSIGDDNYINNILDILKNSCTDIDNNNNNVIFLKIPNKGLDIGSKFCCCHFLKQNNISYNWLISIHSKTNPNARKRYILPLLSSIKNIKTNILLLKQYKAIFPAIVWYGDCNDYTMSKNILYLKDYFNYKNIDVKYHNDFEFIEGNCFIMQQDVFEFIYDDELMYSILNTKDTFDYCWVNHVYNINNNDINSVYKIYKQHNLFPNDIANTQRRYSDCMIEHMFERIYLNILKHLNYDYLVINETISNVNISNINNINHYYDTNTNNNSTINTNTINSNSIKIIYNYINPLMYDNLKYFLKYITNLDTLIKNNYIIDFIINCKINEDLQKLIHNTKTNCKNIDINIFNYENNNDNNNDKTIYTGLYNYLFENTKNNTCEYTTTYLCYLTNECCAFTNNEWYTDFIKLCNNYDIITQCDMGKYKYIQNHFMFCKNNLFHKIWNNFFKKWIYCNYADIFYEKEITQYLFYNDYKIYDIYTNNCINNIYDPVPNHNYISFKYQEYTYKYYNIEHNIKYSNDYIKKLYIIKNIYCNNWFDTFIKTTNNYKLIKLHELLIIYDFFNNKNNLYKNTKNIEQYYFKDYKKYFFIPSNTIIDYNYYDVNFILQRINLTFSVNKKYNDIFMKKYIQNYII